MEDEPSQKRVKTADVVSEEEWLKRHPGNIGITVAVPNDRMCMVHCKSQSSMLTTDPLQYLVATAEFANWNFKGQVLSFQFSCKDTVAALKDKIMAQVSFRVPSSLCVSITD